MFYIFCIEKISYATFSGLAAVLRFAVHFHGSAFGVVRLTGQVVQHCFIYVFGDEHFTNGEAKTGAFAPTKTFDADFSHLYLLLD